MDMPRSKTPLNQQILDEAAAWFVEYREGKIDAGAEGQFNDWLRRSPDHVQYFLQISNFWEDAAILNRRRGELDDLIARARRDLNVHPLDLALTDAAVSTSGSICALTPVRA